MKLYKRSELPDDPEKLKDTIMDLQEQFILYQQTAEDKIEKLLKKIESLEQEVSTLRHSRFGQKSEKRKPITEVPSVLEASSALSSRQTKSSSAKKHQGRRPLPEHLERSRMEHDLKPEEKICSVCQSFMTKIKEIETEQLDIIPSRYIVNQHVRFRYACQKCYGCIKTAPFPFQPIEKGLAGSALLAQVIIDKFSDFLPCYRQERRFARQGVFISRATICHWIIKSASLLKPLVEVMHQKEIIKGNHVFSDDTPMPTLSPGHGKTKQGRLWVYTQKKTQKHGGATVYQYTPTRQGLYPSEFLKGFKGFVQADAYSGFDALFAANERGKPLRIEVGCWAHSRRKFMDILKLHPTSLAQIPVKLIGQLYDIERVSRLRSFTDQKTFYIRRNKAKPILKKLFCWLKKWQKRVPPKMPLGQAIGYALSNWKALTAYLQQGYLEIDNNRSERAIKPIVIGRKNHLFMGNAEGGEAAAILYSLIETCRQNGVEPQSYLTDILQRISTHPHKRIEELLPMYWKKEIKTEFQAA